MGSKEVCAECGETRGEHGGPRGAAKSGHKFVPADQRAAGEALERRPGAGGFETR